MRARSAVEAFRSLSILWVGGACTIAACAAALAAQAEERPTEAQEVRLWDALEGGFSGGGRWVLGPAGRNFAYMEVDDGRCRVVSSAGPGEDFHEIKGAQFFGPRDRFVYFGRRGSEWVRVVDGVAGEAWDEIRVPVVSAEAPICAFAARRGAEWFVMVGEERSGPYAAVGLIRMAEGGRCVAWVARTFDGAGAARATETVFCDGHALGEATGRVWELIFEPGAPNAAWVVQDVHGFSMWANGRRLAVHAGIAEGIWPQGSPSPAWVQFDAERATVVGLPQPDLECQSIFNVCVSRDGNHSAFLARTRDGLRVCHDGKVLSAGTDVTRLALSADGRLVAIATEDRGSSQWTAVMGDLRLHRPGTVRHLAIAGSRNRLLVVADTGDSVEVAASGFCSGTWSAIGPLHYSEEDDALTVVTRRGSSVFRIRYWFSP